MSFLDRNKTGFFITLPVALSLSTGYSSTNLTQLDLNDSPSNYYSPFQETSQTYSNNGLSIKYNKVEFLKSEEKLFKEFLKNSFSQIENSGVLEVNEDDDMQIDKFFTQFHNEYKRTKSKKLFNRA